MESSLRDLEGNAILRAHTMTMWNIGFGELKVSENILRILLHGDCPHFVATTGGRGTDARDGDIHWQGLSASPAPTRRQLGFGDFWQMGECESRGRVKECNCVHEVRHFPGTPGSQWVIFEEPRWRPTEM